MHALHDFEQREIGCVGLRILALEGIEIGAARMDEALAVDEPDAPARLLVSQTFGAHRRDDLARDASCR